MTQTTEEQTNFLSLPEQIYALKTWRYLRLAMVGLALALFAAIVEDRVDGAAHCFQGSISAYYYTPVHGILIGVLVAIGVCLYCLRGSTPVEDVLLNLAGMFAPVVALVPTDPPKGCVSTSIAVQRYANAGNNMFALAFLETFAFLTLLILARRQRVAPTAPRPTSADVLGFKISVAILAVEWVLWVLFRNGHKVYKTPIHYGSAISMLLCIFIVVCVRAAAQKPGHSILWHLRHPSAETWVAILMVISFVVFLYLQLATNWAYAVFQIEFCLIALFMVFWVGQTSKGWHYGLGDQEPVPQIIKRLSAPRG